MGPECGSLLRSIQELVWLGVRFVAATQNIDTDESNPTSRFLLHVFAAFAELEKEMIRARHFRDQNGQNQREINRRPKRIIRRDEAIKMRAEGFSWRKISAKLGIPASTLMTPVITNVIESGC